jgi:hypothetical protein
MAISLRSVYLYIQAQNGSTVKVPNKKRVPTYFAEKLSARGQDESARTTLLGLAEQGLVQWQKQTVTVIKTVDPDTLSDATIYGADASLNDVAIINPGSEISFRPAAGAGPPPRHGPPAPPAAKPPDDSRPPAIGNPAPPATAAAPAAPPVPRPSAMPGKAATAPTSHNGSAGGEKPAYSTATGAKNSRLNGGPGLDPAKPAFDLESQLAKNRELLTANRRLRHEIKTKDDALSDRDQVAARLRERIAELERDAAERDAAVTQAAATHDELVAEHHAQAFELKEAQRQLAAAADTIARLETKIARLTGELARNSVHAANERLGAQIRQLKSDKEELNRAITGLGAELRAAKHQIGNLTEDLQVESTINQNLTNELVHAENALSRLTTGETGQHRLACGHIIIISFDPDHKLDADHPDCKMVNLSEIERTEPTVYKQFGYRPQPDVPRHERRGQTHRKKPRRR